MFNIFKKPVIKQSVITLAFPKYKSDKRPKMILAEGRWVECDVHTSNKLQKERGVLNLDMLAIETADTIYEHESSCYPVKNFMGVRPPKGMEVTSFVDHSMWQSVKDREKMEALKEDGSFRPFTAEAYAKYLIERKVLNEYTTASDFAMMDLWETDFLITKRCALPSTLGAGSHHFTSVKEYMINGREHRPNLYEWGHNYTDIVSKSHIPVYGVGSGINLSLELKKLGHNTEALDLFLEQTKNN